MSQTYGMESPKDHTKVLHRMPVWYLVVIESAGLKIARLFLATYEMVAEMDAAVEEVSSMIAGLTPVTGALGTQWDGPLAALSPDERASAAVYTLAV